MAGMLSMEAWRESAENKVGEDEVLNECLKQHIKQFGTVFFSATCTTLLGWCSAEGVR